MLVFALALLGAAATAASAQDAIPDLKGTWSGKGKAIVSAPIPTIPAANRCRSAAGARYRGDPCRGGPGWPRCLGALVVAVADNKEPFAWAIASDNRSIVGADMDGYFRITLISPERMEKCYVHNGVSPSRSVVATCYLMDRVRR